MRKATLAAFGAATLLAISPLSSAFAVSAGVNTNTSVGVSGPNGAGSTEAQTKGSAKGSVGVHTPRAGAAGPTGSASAEAQTKGTVNPHRAHHSGGVITNKTGATGSAATH